jgi:hypothetical protein
MARRILLLCGVLASLLYVGIDVLAAIWYGDYHSFNSQTISELMARGAPTEKLVNPLFTLYGMLMLAFGVGVWLSAGGRPSLQASAAALIAYAVAGLPGPWLFQMNMRGTGTVEQDVPHIVLTMVIVVFALVAMVSAAFAFDRRFRVYSLGTIAALLVLGGVTGFLSTGLATGQPTPWLGIAERANLGVMLVWVAALAEVLLREPRQLVETKGGQLVAQGR